MGKLFSIVFGLIIIIGYSGCKKKKNNFDANWQQINNGLPANSEVKTIAIDGANIIISTYVSGPYLGDFTGGVYLSTNNGDNWSIINNELPTNTAVNSLVFNNSIIFAGLANGNIYLSTNNGSNWELKSNGLGCNSIYTLALNGSNIYAGTSAGIYLSTDNGNNWTKLSNGLPSVIRINSIIFDEEKIFAAADSSSIGKIFLSIDNGANWTSISNGLPNIFISLMVKCGSSIFVGTGTGVYKFNNNNNNWLAVNNGLPTAGIVAALANSGSNIYAGIPLNNGVFGVYFSGDSGSIWSSFSNGLPSQGVMILIYFLAANNTYIYAATNNGIWRSNLE